MWRVNFVCWLMDASRQLLWVCRSVGPMHWRVVFDSSDSSVIATVRCHANLTHSGNSPPPKLQSQTILLVTTCANWFQTLGYVELWPTRVYISQPTKQVNFVLDEAKGEPACACVAAFRWHLRIHVFSWCVNVPHFTLRFRQNNSINTHLQNLCSKRHLHTAQKSSLIK